MGEGHPLLLIPGWVSHLELDTESPHAAEIIERLASRFKLIRYDKRGTGLSDRDVTDYSLEHRLLDVDAVIERTGIERYAIRGVSEGGPVAIAHAARYPERVSHLVLQGTYAYLGHSETADALITLIAAEWGLGSATMTNIFMPSATKEQQEFFVRYQKEAASRADAAAMLRANIETDVRDVLAEVQAPTLVIHSETDRAVPFRHARELAGAINNASLMQYKGDHAPIEAWDQLNDAVVDFVSGTEPAPAPGLAQTGLLTIMFTDLEASTAMTRRLGDEAAQSVLRRHNEVIRGALKQNGGAEIKHTGDGIMASFQTASAALGCAASIQRTFASQNEQDRESRVRVRIGLNAGEPVAEEGDLFGTAVQMAARICARAEPGQILAANVVRELAAGESFLFADAGDVILRGFEDPVRLYEVHWSAASA
jgi:class 3 adenylate cyclase/pimeloyl-ACP methyl ester carboxylesterase